MNKEKICRIKNTPVGITALLLSLIGLQIYYFYSFINSGLFSHYGYNLSGLSTILQPLILSFLFTITAISLILIIYAFLLRRIWGRKFTILFIIWAMTWSIWSLLVGNLVILNLILMMIYGCMILILSLTPVVEYFKNIFKFGDYTLYKRIVALKSKRIVTIHFFSKKIPKSGEPTYIPYGYEVHVSSRSKMPYLQKCGHIAYKYGRYTLYSRYVTLKNGKKMPFYFFSKKKPKSGKPSPLPKKYVVKENQRSHMPYLRKKQVPGFLSHFF